jgi:hypothetical protein
MWNGAPIYSFNREKNRSFLSFHSALFSLCLSTLRLCIAEGFTQIAQRLFSRREIDHALLGLGISLPKRVLISAPCLLNTFSCRITQKDHMAQ